MPTLADIREAVGAAGFRLARPFVPKRYVVVHGFYGEGNVGDEAILAATLEAIRQAGAEPFVFAWNPERVRADFGVPSLNPNRTRRLKVWRVLLQARAYLLGGGGLIKDYGGGPRSLGEWLVWLDAARQLGVKTMTWSVGVENLLYPESKARVREVFEHVDVVTVRDAGSAERLREVGLTREIIVTADPVPHLARKHARPRGRAARLRVLACMRHWYPYEFRVPDEDANQQMMSAVAGALDHLVEEHGAEVAFLPFRTLAKDDDREACRAIQQRMRSASTLYDDPDPSVEMTMDRIAKADLVFGMRLHASVIATSMGIPTIAISYMPKVRDYMVSINHDEWCVDVGCFSEKDLVGLSRRIMDHHGACSASLLASTAESADRFDMNGKLLGALLHGSGTPEA